MHAENFYAERVIRTGAKGYISKLASPFEVIKAVKKVLDGHIYVSELINMAILERLVQENNTAPPLKIAELSDREIEVFQLIGCGLNSRECAECLHLGASTIDSYLARIKEKLGIKNAAELYQRAAQWLVENNI
jgi:DNA-binding NarL/FixJ family response regulator